MCACAVCLIVGSGLKAPAEPSLPTHIVYFSISPSEEIFQK